MSQASDVGQLLRAAEEIDDLLTRGECDGRPYIVSQSLARPLQTLRETSLRLRGDRPAVVRWLDYRE